MEDSYAVDTYRVADGIIVRTTDHKHIDADKKKIIIANKSGFAGMFIDDGRLSLCGSDKFYILGENLDNLLTLLNYKLFKMVCYYMKYRMSFLSQDCFDYIPDIRTGITEEELYDAFELTKEEIDLIEKTLWKNLIPCKVSSIKSQSRTMFVSDKKYVKHGKL